MEIKIASNSLQDVHLLWILTDKKMNLIKLKYHGIFLI